MVAGRSWNFFERLMSSLCPLAPGSFPASCLKEGSLIFIAFTVVLCLYFSVCDYISIFLPPTLHISLPSSVDRSSYFFHSSSSSFALSLPLELSLSDPLKRDHIMFFPSCFPPTLRWGGEPPAGGIKDMIYRAPSQQKRDEDRKKNTKWKISFPAQ